MSELSICIPIELPEHGGGGFRFLRSFEGYLDAQGVARTRRISDGARVLLANSWQVPFATIVRATWRRPDVTVVQRIDGAAQDYGRDPRADRAQARVNRVADLTIFQSRYCRHSTREKFPVISHDGPIVHNPVDLETFRPDGPRATLPPWNGPRIAAITWSTNPRKGSGSLYRVARSLPEAQLVLCGRYADAPDLPNIARMGVLDATELATVLRACDVFATFAENEACPNVVLEALASGLPVLYKDSGAAAELVEACGSAVSEESFARALADVMTRHDELSRDARERAEECFAPARAFAVYLEHIERALRPRTGRLSRVAGMVRAAW